MALLRRKNGEMNLTEGPFCKKLFIVAFPLILTSILQLLYSSADLIVCGQFGSDHAVAAISSTGSVSALLVNLCIGLSVGANVVFARYYGTNQKEEGKKVSDTSMMISVIGGLIVGVVGFFGAKTFLRWMETPDEVLDLSTTYLKIYFAGVPFAMIYNFGSALLRALGETKRPLYFASLSGFINVLLNLVFVIFLKMDVGGVALATAIAQFLSATMMLIYLSRYKGFLVFSLNTLKFDKKAAREIIRIGVPTGVQTSIFSIANVLIQSSINSLGPIAMDGSGASTSIESFVHEIMTGFNTASIAFVSANYGCHNKENIKKSIRATLILGVSSSILTSIICLIFRYPLLSLYLRYDDAIGFALERMYVVMPFYFLCSIMDAFSFALRGLGKSMTAMIGSIIGVCGFRIVWVYAVFWSGLWPTLGGIIAAWPVTWIVTLFIQAFSVRRELKKIPDTVSTPSTSMDN